MENTQEVYFCLGLLHGDRENVRLIGRGNEVSYLETQAAMARRANDRAAAIAYQAAANHWRDGSHAKARNILQDIIDTSEGAAS